MKFYKFFLHVFLVFSAFLLSSCWEPIEVHFYKHSIFNVFSEKILHTFDLKSFLGEFSEREDATDKKPNFLKLRKSWLFCFNSSFVMDMKSCSSNLKAINPSLENKFEITGIAVIPFENKEGYITVVEVKAFGYFSLLKLEFQEDRLILRRISFDKKLLLEYYVTFEFESNANAKFYRLLIHDQIRFEAFTRLMTEQSPLYPSEKNSTITLFPRYPAQLSVIQQATIELSKKLKTSCKSSFIE